MSTSAISALSGTSSPFAISRILHQAASTTTRQSSVASLAAVQQSDNSRLSPLAELLSSLQQLQQSNPTKYSQVTQQIASNLQTAAQTASAQGNTTAASQLTWLATDFISASSSNQIPNVQDLAQAIGGHRQHGHGGSNTDTSNTSSSSFNRFLSAFQANNLQNNALDATSIIQNTLANAGIKTS